MRGFKHSWMISLTMVAMLVCGPGCGSKKPSGRAAKASPSSKPETFTEIKQSWTDFVAKVKGNVVAASRKWTEKYKGSAALTIEDFKDDVRKEVTDEEYKKNAEQALKNAPDVGELKFKTHELLGTGFFEDYDYAIKFTRVNRAWVFKEGKVKLTNSQKKDDPRLGAEVPMSEKDLEQKYFKDLLGLKTK